MVAAIRKGPPSHSKHTGLFENTTSPDRFIAEGGIAQGKLVEVLKPCGGASRPFSLIHPESWRMPLRGQPLLNFLASSLRS